MKGEPEPNVAVEIHDSTLDRLEPGDDGLVAVISAYVHRSAGTPGVDAGSGWSQTLHLRFVRGRATGSLEAIPMELLEGHLDVAGEKFGNMIPMPMDRVGSARLELRSWNDAEIVIEGDGVTGSLVGPARWVEEFAPNRRRIP